MFHAIGKPLGFSGHALRKLVCDFIERNPDAALHDASVRDWVLWDSGLTPQNYVRRLRAGYWGGSLETTILASLLRTPIFVYEPKGQMCTRLADSRPDERIELFETGRERPPFICLLYVRKNHYMYLKILF